MRASCALAVLLGSLVVTESVHAASEMEDRARVVATVRQAFLDEKFAELEESAHSYRVSKARTSSGLWLLTLFYGGLREAIREQTSSGPRDTSFEALYSKIGRWEGQFPRSPVAHIMRSMAHIEHAWAYRGSGYVDTVRPEDWAPFNEYLDKARGNLEAYKAISAVDPKWYEEMLVIAKAQGWPQVEFNALLSEALDKEPDFYQTYFMALEYLLPKWHGSSEEIEAFARAAVKRTSASEGWGMYARIYWYASQTEYQNALFHDSSAAWSRMKRGFEDVIARYPDAWNLNNYAKFACVARDGSKTRELMKRIQSDIVEEAWDSPAMRGACARFDPKLPDSYKYGMLAAASGTVLILALAYQAFRRRRRVSAG